ncbi:MAG TPA: HEAT repeat domain-containing protein [Gemmatimonadaceae bacterium]|nr:HEAT repeat domain-containing protein [Gemmatimonadaceae bacterium]
MLNRINPAGMAGVLVIMACLVPPRTEAQGIARRVSAVRDGKVRLTFAAREEICGYGDGISTGPNRKSNNGRTTFTSDHSEDVIYERECSEGPVRVVITMSAGAPERIKTYVGGRWRQTSGVTDIGNVSVRDATDYLLTVANTQSGKAAGEAIFPVTLADSINAAQPLYALAKNSARPKDVRGQAIFWLSQLEDDRAVSMLDDILKTSRDEDIGDKAIFGLSQHRSGKGFPILRSYAESDANPEDLRGKAIFWLGQRRSGDGENYLRGLYSRIRSEELRDKIIFSMSQQKSVESNQWLLDLVSNSNEPLEMRKKALFWAGQGGASIEKLASMYSRMDNREMKDQMIFVFSQRHERAALDKLMDIAKNDPDREARRKAMFWLGQSKDSRVAGFLSEMINR